MGVSTRIGAPKSLTAAQREFLENPFVGVVVDLRPDGSPHATVVWVDVDDDGVSFNTAWPRAKPRYLDADPRVSLTVLDPGDPYRWISITGRATLVAAVSPELHPVPELPAFVEDADVDGLSAEHVISASAANHFHIAKVLHFPAHTVRIG